MLGRHYPLDIIGGWLVGILFGLIILQIHKLWMSKLNALK